MTTKGVEVSVALGSGRVFEIQTPLKLSDFHSTQKLGFKRVMLFTNNDNPHVNNAQLKVRVQGHRKIFAVV